MLGVDGLLNVFLAEANISIDDFINANKGEILFSVSDFKIERKEMKESYGDGEAFTYKTELPSAKILFATSVKEKASFEKLINVLTETLNKEGAEAAEMLNKIPYTLTDKWFIAGNDSSAVHSFGTVSTNHDFISKIKGHPMGGYLNIQNFIKGAKNTIAKDSVGTLIADKSIQTWNDIIFYGGEFKDGGVESYAEINMVDQKTNSLKQLNSYFGFLAKLMRDQEKVRKEEYKMWDDEATIDATKQKNKPLIVKKNHRQHLVAPVVFDYNQSMLFQIDHLIPTYFEPHKKEGSEIWGKRIDFTTGELIKIVAPSGSGKTSLIHFIYGLRNDYNGKIIFKGKDISLLKRKILLLFAAKM